jgi:hypothetical protein
MLTLHPSNVLAEGSSVNAFIVKGGAIIIPIQDN